MRRPRDDRLEIALVARDGGADRLRPDEEVGRRAVTALGGQYPRDVHERFGLGGEGPEAGRPRGRGQGGVAEPFDEGPARLIEIGQGDRLGAPAVGEDPGRLFDEQDGVLDSRQRLPISAGAIDRLTAGRAEDEEMTRRDSRCPRWTRTGRKRLQRDRVRTSCRSGPGALEERMVVRVASTARGSPGCPPAEIARGHGRQQVSRHVGG